jgi:hypothetical protein
MENYNEYLKELKTTTLFQGIADGELIALLDAMQPKIVHMKAGEKPVMDPAYFRVILRADPEHPVEKRYFPYDMPKFGEPGMMMGEIPSLSKMFTVIKKHPQMPKGHKPPDMNIDALELSGEMVTAFYGEKIAAAQGKMLRNFLGILAQKVTDVRRELFLLRDGTDMYEGVKE